MDPVFPAGMILYFAHMILKSEGKVIPLDPPLQKKGEW